ncbi:hypothetical protein ACFE04_010705 [Oxalis oulophora]
MFESISQVVKHSYSAVVVSSEDESHSEKFDEDDPQVKNYREEEELDRWFEWENNEAGHQTPTRNVAPEGRISSSTSPPSPFNEWSSSRVRKEHLDTSSRIWWC